jgi:hypothetical protein
MKRVVLWILVCVATPVVAFCSFLTWISIAVNWHPPEMFSRQFAGQNHSNREELSTAITEILKKNFPSGTIVSDLKSSLHNEGFRDVPPPPPNCVPRDKEAEVPLHTTYTSCYDNRNQMEYSWAIGLVCGDYVYIKWATDEDGKVVRIEGYDNSACL